MKTQLLNIICGVVMVFGQNPKVITEFALANQKFAATIYKEITKSLSGNFLVCPLSVQVSIALAHAGAKGETAHQLAAGVNLPNDRAKIQEIFHELLPFLQVNDTYVLTSANKLYVADRFKLEDQYRHTAVNSFQADVENIAFTPSSQAASEMNKWIEIKTLGKIKDLIKKQYLDASTVAVLVNTMYFKGTWSEQFDPEITFPLDFYVNSTYTINVPIMHASGQFRNYDDNELNARFLELPYEGNDVSMTIVLPNGKDGLPALEERIDDIFLDYPYVTSLGPISIPKFNIETRIDFDEILKALGVQLPFTERADFRDMGYGTVPIHLSRIAQKAFIEVNEKGTTAGAATGSAVTDKIAPAFSFHADHPFIFFLKHRISGVFFVGRFTGHDDTGRIRSRIAKTTPVTPQLDRFVWE